MPSTNPSTRPLWKRLLFRRLKFLAVVAVLLAVLLGGSYLFAPQWLMRADATRKAMAAHLESKTVHAGDTRWSYYEGGEGPTIVLLHGFDSRKEVWLPVARLLTAHFHLVIPDLPGWGQSSRVPGGNYDIDAQAARLQDFMQALGLQRVLLVGHSMGGAIAGVYATEHPEHVGELALLDSFGLKFRENAFAKAALAGKDPFAYDDRAGFRRAMALAFDQPPQIPGRFVDVLVKWNVRHRAFIERTFDALRQPSQALSLQHRLGDLRMPVLGLWCHDDRIIDISALDSLRNGLTHAAAISATTLNGCGHMPMLEKPEATAQVLTAFALSH
jgi:pimeloyl-ACP methyl ester carboxylesterase